MLVLFFEVTATLTKKSLLKLLLLKLFSLLYFFSFSCVSAKSIMGVKALCVDFISSFTVRSVIPCGS